MTIVRKNLLTQLGYTPYCGNDGCRFHWPRTKFNGKQFECSCGWQSAFEPEFIEAYKAAQVSLANPIHFGPIYGRKWGETMSLCKPPGTSSTMTNDWRAVTCPKCIALNPVNV